MDYSSLQGKKVAVLGLGTEGIALCDFLLDKVASITVLDALSENEILKRLEGEERKNASVVLTNGKINKILGPNYLNDLKKYDIIFRSPGISYFNQKIQAAKEAGVEISSQIKLFFELCPSKIIGVTGTKGKGTTASLIYEIMKRKSEVRNSKSETNFNSQILNEKINGKWKMENGKLLKVYLAGNIGYPAITLIPNIQKDDLVVLELSSFQLMDLDKSPHVAVVTNLSIDHMDYHQDEEEYLDAKANIILHQTKNDYSILNKDSTFKAEILNNLPSNIQFFSRADSSVEVFVNENDEVILDPAKRNIKIADLNSIKLFGRHNLENIAAAALTADILGVDTEIIKESVIGFVGLPHRLEFVAEINGVKYINDSFATNPEPAKAAINSFANDKILILGGSSKNADFSELAENIVASNIKAVILIGDEGLKIKTTLRENDFKGQLIDGKNEMYEIVLQTSKVAENGDVVLLSPACASFGMFKNYKERGENFKTAVLKLKSEIRSTKSETNTNDQNDNV